jgi:lysophospholipase L1-like esterase
MIKWGLPLLLVLGLLVHPDQVADGPILLTLHDNPFRPIALNASTYTQEPFTLLTESNLSSDKRTRLLLFGLNVTDSTRVFMRDRRGVEAVAVIEAREQLIGSTTQMAALVPQVFDGPVTIWLEDRGRESSRGVIAFEFATIPQQVNLIFAGNSLTVGYDTQNPLPAEYNYPTRACQELLRQGYSVQCYNKGIGGQTTTEMLQRAADQIDPLIQGPSVVVVWELGNDLMFTSSSEEQLFQNIKTYCLGRRQRGARIAVMTVPFRADIANNPTKSAILNRINQRIRTEYKDFTDLLIDLTLDPRLPNLMQSDKVHFLPTGYAAIAEDVVTDIRTLL